MWDFGGDRTSPQIQTSKEKNNEVSGKGAPECIYAGV